MSTAYPADAITAFLRETNALPADDLAAISQLVANCLGADAARILVADYALASLQELGEDGPTGLRQAIDGTLAGRAFVREEVVTSGDGPVLVFVPLVQDGDRFGVLELTHSDWNADRGELVDALVRVLVLVLINKRRFTDIVARSRRVRPLSPAAEMQWDLLPPATCSTSRVSISAVLEPAYSIGGDSFDFALNPKQAEFAIIDAVGHGTSAVAMSVAAINSVRNRRREGTDLETTYYETGEAIASQFGSSYFVTGQLGALTLDTGVLDWLNAGHPLPLLVRNDSFVGELPCAPSLPMGLGGSVREIATVQLQRGDRVLFFTDGVAEARSVEGEEFGVPRLADFLVRATLDRVSPAETVRRLSMSVIAHNHAGLADDATLLLLDYHGADAD